MDPEQPNTPREPITETLRLRTEAQEQAERGALEEAATAEDALKHKRRADKAAYLRDKLEEQSQADEQARDDSRS